MAPFPVKGLEVAEFDQGYESANGPFVVRTPSNSEYVVINALDYSSHSDQLAKGEKQMLLEGLTAIERGDVFDAETALNKIRAKYEI